MADTVAYVRSVEDLIIDTLADLGLGDVGRLRDYPGVWVEPGSDRPRKICAIGVKLTRARTMHGFALNVDPDMAYFRHIVPCGITDKPVTSLAAEGIDVSMKDVVDAVTARAVARWGTDGWERQDVVWRHHPGDRDLSPFSRGEGPGEHAAPVRLRRPAGRGRGDRRPPDRRAQAAVAAGQGADGRRLPPAQADDA